MTEQFDAIVIGTGQAGPPLAVRLAASGRKTAIIERKRFGGTCVNVGCMPTKTLIASARAAHVVRNAADFGIVVDGAIRSDMPRIKARKDAIVAESTGNVQKWLRGTPNLSVIEGHARFEGPRSVTVGDRRLGAPEIFINTGGRPTVPAVEGLATVDYLSSTSIMDLDSLPEHLHCHRRELYRSRVRADVSTLREPGDGDRNGAPLDRTRGRRGVAGRAGDPRRRRHRHSFECPVP